MQAVSCFVQPLFHVKHSVFVSSPSKIGTLTSSRPICVVKATSSVAPQSLSFNYNSPFSVFPAEACEIVGGDACEAAMHPEVKFDEPKMMSQTNRTEKFDREYFDYNSDPKSVLRGEACDDLGGEFCEAPYTKGVY